MIREMIQFGMHTPNIFIPSVDKFNRENLNYISKISLYLVVSNLWVVIPKGNMGLLSIRKKKVGNQSTITTTLSMVLIDTGKVTST